MSVFDDVFEVFSIGFPERKRQSAVDRKTLRDLEGKLPTELLDLYAEEGLFTFADGLFFFENPLKQKTVLKSWGIDPGENFLFLRTAFGDFFYWDGSSVHVMHVNSGVENTLSPAIPKFLNFGIHSKKYNDKTLFGRLLKKAKSRLGDLRADECYGFVPAIPMGGKESADNLQKVKLSEYLSILARSFS